MSLAQLPESIPFNKDRRVINFYLLAKSIVSENFSHEIEWQDSLQFSDIGESAFLREAAWVVLSSGMREVVIRSKFPSFSLAFYDWQSALQISANAEQCRKNASQVFAHMGKLDAIIEIAATITKDGFETFKCNISTKGVPFLQSLPFIGPTTSFHLAKNIGLDVVKPDRHLVRISAMAGYSCPAEMCKVISEAVGDRLSVVDLVVWRYATLNPGYRSYLSRCI